MSELTDLTRDRMDVWIEGYAAGYSHGLEVGHARGYAACDAEIAALQRAAMGVVHRAADAILKPDYAPASLLTREERMARYARAAARIQGASTSRDLPREGAA